MVQARTITYGTDRADEVNKMFIILLFFLLILFTFGRSILIRARKFPPVSLVGWVSDQPIRINV